MALDPSLTSQLDGLTFNDGAAERPLTEHSFFKDAPDFKTFAERAFQAHREVGARIPVKVKDDAERAEWRKTHLPRLYEAGILPKPPASPDEYKVERPETIPDGFGWNDELATEFKQVLHKHGIPASAVQDLLGLHAKTVSGVSELWKHSEEETMLALKKEFGNDFDQRFEEGKRLASSIFKTPEELELFERSGLGNNPTFLSVFMRLAPLAMQDSSFVEGMQQSSSANGGKLSAEEAHNELAQIMTNKDHPMYKGYHSNDPKVQQHIDNLFKRAGFVGQVEIS